MCVCLCVRVQVLDVPEAPQRLEWVGSTLCMAFSREFSLLNVETGMPTQLARRTSPSAFLCCVSSFFYLSLLLIFSLMCGF